jgi:methionine--tRNA ligase beta chain
MLPLMETSEDSSSRPNPPLNIYHAGRFRSDVQEQIDISEFRKVDIRIGKVVEAERVQGTDRLIRLTVDFGGVRKQALTGLGHLYQPEHFLGRKFAFVTNLKPKKVRGLVSECMILAAMKDENEVVPLVPERDIAEGSQVL